MLLLERREEKSALEAVICDGEESKRLAKRKID